MGHTCEWRVGLVAVEITLQAIIILSRDSSPRAVKYV